MARAHGASCCRRKARSALRKAKLTRSFNKGYRSYSRTYNTCSPSAQNAINRFLTEGAQIADGLVQVGALSAQPDAIDPFTVNGACPFSAHISRDMQGRAAKRRGSGASVTADSRRQGRVGRARDPGGNPCSTFEGLDRRRFILQGADLILDAWDEGTESGVPTEQMAYAALFTALTDLVAQFGEDAVVKLARGLEQRINVGEFTLHRTRQ